MKKINCNAWRTLADYVYDGDDREVPSENCVVYVPLDNIAEFFRKCVYSKCKFVVISALSDYGIEYQSTNPVVRDMQRWLQFISVPSEIEYDPLIVPSRCRPSYCKIDDAISVKMYSYTKDTFDAIPNNIQKWYSTNCNVFHNKIVHIPFGIPDWSYDIVDRYKNNNLLVTNLYVNFESNTIERSNLKRALQQVEWCDCVLQPISAEEYIKHLATHRFILSPTGNGLDCYRTLESLYVSSTPVIEKGEWSKAYQGLPVIELNSYNELSMGDLQTKLMALKNKPDMDLAGTRADFEYWERKIDAERVDL